MNLKKTLAQGWLLKEPSRRLSRLFRTIPKGVKPEERTNRQADKQTEKRHVLAEILSVISRPDIENSINLAVIEHRSHRI